MAAIFKNGRHLLMHNLTSGRQGDYGRRAPGLFSAPCLPSPQVCSRVYSWLMVYTCFWLIADTADYVVDVVAWSKPKHSLDTLDPNQFGGLKQRSTAHALVSMLHSWCSTLYQGGSVRALFVDFTKAWLTHVLTIRGGPIPGSALVVIFGRSIVALSIA